MKLKAHKEYFLYFSTHSTSYCASSKGLIDISWKKSLTVNVGNSGKIKYNWFYNVDPLLSNKFYSILSMKLKQNKTKPYNRKQNDRVLTLEFVWT